MVRRVKTYLLNMRVIDDEMKLNDMSLVCEAAPGKIIRFVLPPGVCVCIDVYTTTCYTCVCYVWCLPPLGGVTVMVVATRGRVLVATFSSCDHNVLHSLLSADPHHALIS